MKRSSARVAERTAEVTASDTEETGTASSVATFETIACRTLGVKSVTAPCTTNERVTVLCEEPPSFLSPK